MLKSGAKKGLKKKKKKNNVEISQNIFSIGRLKAHLLCSTFAECTRTSRIYSAFFENRFRLVVSTWHRRRSKTEEKAKVVAAVWGTECFNSLTR